MSGTQAKGGKKNRKFNRNKVFCEKYTKEGRRIKNKIRKLLRHLKRFPNDLTAKKCLKGL